MPVSNQTKNQHVLWRAGFGPNNNDTANAASFSAKNKFKELVSNSSQNIVAFHLVENRLDGLSKAMENVQRLKDLTKEERNEMRKLSREKIKNLNTEWLDQMVNSNQQLREKMALFWHNHFACRNLNIYFQQTLINIIRENALGNFGDLLKAVSTSAAMLQFLNNQQNRKQHPNENFAREVMELFTLGRGNYTETDVKEAARAFTGWSFDVSCEFVFRERLHDNDSKTILGKSGKFNGEDVLNILLEQKQTARYITRKLYKYLVNETSVDDAKVEWLANRFYQSNYSIKNLLEDIFTSDWFYDKKNIGAKIKSPVELLVGIRRTIPMEFSNQEVQLLFQRVLGQMLFYPPNVAGWPGGKTWIDSSTLMFRMRLPQLITNADEFTIKPKDMDDEMAEYTITEKRKAFKKMGGLKVDANVNWQAVIQQYEKVKRENLFEYIAASLLTYNEGSIKKEIIEKYIDSSTKENYIKGVVVQLMCTPEYQLC